ncbi:MAG: hypothetical protein ACE5Z5_13650 [Candidatus Bathyarchaeia archaeon]
MENEVIERGKLRVKRRSQASRRVLERLMNPPDLGALKIKPAGEEIYEDASSKP